MPTPSIGDLNTQILSVNVSSDGVAQWPGTNGEKSVLQNLVSRLHDCGVPVYDNSSLLSLIGGADTKMVAIKDSGLYCYVSAGTPLPTDIPAMDGGRWQLLAPFGAVTYSKPIGNSTNTAFTLTHNLRTLTPSVAQLEPDTPGSNVPSTLTAPTGTVKIIDENTITVTYGAAPGTAQYIIVVKK